MEKFNNEDLQLGVKECKAYHNGLMQSKSIMEFDRLRHLYILDMAEDDRDTSRQYSKVLGYHHDKRANN